MLINRDYIGNRIQPITDTDWIHCWNSNLYLPFLSCWRLRASCMSHTSQKVVLSYNHLKYDDSPLDQRKARNKGITITSVSLSNQPFTVRFAVWTSWKTHVQTCQKCHLLSFPFNHSEIWLLFSCNIIPDLAFWRTKWVQSFTSENASDVLRPSIHGDIVVVSCWYFCTRKTELCERTCYIL